MAKRVDEEENYFVVDGSNLFYLVEGVPKDPGRTDQPFGVTLSALGQWLYRNTGTYWKGMVQAEQSQRRERRILASDVGFVRKKDAKATLASPLARTAQEASL